VSGWRVLFAVSAVVLVIFGAMLLMLKITGTGGNNAPAPTPTPIVWRLPGELPM
jgi:hypothetical protein